MLGLLDPHQSIGHCTHSHLRHAICEIHLQTRHIEARFSGQHPGKPSASGTCRPCPGETPFAGAWLPLPWSFRASNTRLRQAVIWPPGAAVSRRLARTRTRWSAIAPKARGTQHAMLRILARPLACDCIQYVNICQPHMGSTLYPAALIGADHMAHGQLMSRYRTSGRSRSRRGIAGLVGNHPEPDGQESEHQYLHLNVV